MKIKQVKENFSKWRAKPSVQSGIGTAKAVSGVALSILAIALLVMKLRGINPLKNSAVMNFLLQPESIAMVGGFGIAGMKSGLTQRKKAKRQKFMAERLLDGTGSFKTWETTGEEAVKALSLLTGAVLFGIFAYNGVRFLKGNLKGAAVLMSGGGLLYYSMNMFKLGLKTEKENLPNLEGKSVHKGISKAMIGVGVVSLLFAAAGIGLHYVKGLQQVKFLSSITQVAPASMVGLGICGGFLVKDGYSGVKEAASIGTLSENGTHKKLHPAKLVLGILGLVTAGSLAALQIWGIVDSAGLYRLTGLKFSTDLVATSTMAFWTMGAGVFSTQLLADSKTREPNS